MNRPTALHAIDCGCSRCAPPGPAARASLTPGDRFAILTLAGVTTGLAIVGVIGGPGLLAAFGF